MTLNKGEPEYLKSFLLSAGAGSIFGLVAGILAYRVETYPWLAPIFIAGATLLSGLFSGLAGLGGAYLDERLRRRGLKKALPRLIISFSAVALLTVVLAFLGISFFGAVPPDSEVWRTTAAGIAAGLAFGAVFALGWPGTFPLSPDLATVIIRGP